MKIPIILKFIFQQVPTQTILWMVIFLSYANGIPLNTLETSSYGSLNSGAQQASSIQCFLLLTRVLIQITPFIIKRTRRRKLLPRKHDYY
jgi:hypothetical protein